MSITAGCWIRGAGAIAVTGTEVYVAEAVCAGTGAVAATGSRYRPHNAEAAPQGAGTLAVDSSVTFAIAASCASTGRLVAAGEVFAYAACSCAATGALTAVGDVTLAPPTEAVCEGAATLSCLARAVFAASAASAGTGAVLTLGRVHRLFAYYQPSVRPKHGVATASYRRGLARVNRAEAAMRTSAATGRVCVSVHAARQQTGIVDLCSVVTTLIESVRV